MDFIDDVNNPKRTIISNFQERYRGIVIDLMTPDMEIRDEAYDTGGNFLPNMFSLHSETRGDLSKWWAKWWVRADVKSCTDEQKCFHHLVEGESDVPCGDFRHDQQLLREKRRRA